VAEVVVVGVEAVVEVDVEPSEAAPQRGVPQRAQRRGFAQRDVRPVR
jgi:hypothetical protein